MAVIHVENARDRQWELAMSVSGEIPVTMDGLDDWQALMIPQGRPVWRLLTLKSQVPDTGDAQC